MCSFHRLLNLIFLQDQNSVQPLQEYLSYEERLSFLQLYHQVINPHCIAQFDGPEAVDEERHTKNGHL